MAIFLPASTRKPKKAQNAERGKNQRVVRPSVKACNNCKKPNHFAKLCRVKKQTNHFVGKEAIIEENNGTSSDYSYFTGHTDYIKNGTMENIKVNENEMPMMRDTGASLTLISTKPCKQIETEI